VTDPVGAAIDGRGIALDRYGLPIQIDRGLSPAPEPSARRAVLAVSATAAVFRSAALRDAALCKTLVFDPTFGSYHEDLDLGLRLGRLGWRSAWVPGAWVRHVGSASGRRLEWRHPWWLLSNRWRALAGNLTGTALLSALPVLLRGELRAVHSLVRDNPRALVLSAAVLACLPRIVKRSLGRPSPGPRLTALPEAA
jgi:GT2 family glycosyltransferase